MTQGRVSLHKHLPRMKSVRSTVFAVPRSSQPRVSPITTEVCTYFVWLFVRRQPELPTSARVPTLRPSVKNRFTAKTRFSAHCVR